MLAEWTGLEPATPGVTGRYSNQLNYHSNQVKPTRIATPTCCYFSVWWVLTGSNRRHPACKASALPTELSTRFVPQHKAGQFTASFRPLPARNFGTLAALILIDAPVLGFRPLRAARLPT